VIGSRRGCISLVGLGTGRKGLPAPRKNKKHGRQLSQKHWEKKKKSRYLGLVSLRQKEQKKNSRFDRILRRKKGEGGKKRGNRVINKGRRGALWQVIVEERRGGSWL